VLKPGGVIRSTLYLSPLTDSGRYIK